jgi:hypothetical protein
VLPVFLVKLKLTSPRPESAALVFRAAMPTRSSHPVAGILRSSRAVVSRQHLRDTRCAAVEINRMNGR